MTEDAKLKGNFYRGPTFVNGELYECKSNDAGNAGFVAILDKARQREALELELSGITSLMRGADGYDQAQTESGFDA